MTMTKKASSIETLRSWVHELEREGLDKSASTGPMGKTTHPSDKADDGTQKATEGFLAADNKKEVEKMVPANVDGVKSVSTKGQDTLQQNKGVTQSATGEDASVEDNYKDRPKGSPTSFAADADVGEKYSKLDLSKHDDLRKAAAALSELANSILADITVGTMPQTKKSAEVAKTEEPKNQETTKQADAPVSSSPSATDASPSPGDASVSSKAAAQAGYELAAALGLSKEAADSVAQNVVENLITNARLLGDHAGRLLVRLHKEAEEGPMDPNKASLGKDGPPPDATDGPAPAGLADALGASAGEPPVEGGPGGGPGGPGGPPPGPPMDGGGAPPMGGGAPGGMNPQAIQELAMALMELGGPQILDQLAAAAKGAEGAAPGAADMGAKVASAVQQHMRSGKFEFTEAKKGSIARKMRDDMKRNIQELLAR